MSSTRLSLFVTRLASGVQRVFSAFLWSLWSGQIRGSEARGSSCDESLPLSNASQTGFGTVQNQGFLATQFITTSADEWFSSSEG